tara:strand:- start:572 stop:1495 length:924 start_codon:yes stop_codon:yes gene_type:complete
VGDAKGYLFKDIDACNMCRSTGNSQKLLGHRLNCHQGAFPSKKKGVSTSVFKCRLCGLVYPSPIPIPLSIEDHYGIVPEEYWDNDYFFIPENWMKNEINFFNELNSSAATDGSPCALDIGAGIGKTMITLQQNGFDVMGIEPGEQFHNHAVTKMGIDKEKIIHSTLEDASFADKSFDWIIFGAVLEHLYDPYLALSKAMKWLKPGGLVQLEVPNSSWLTSLLVNRFYKMTGQNYVANISPMHSPFHIYEFSTKTFEINGKLLGYEIAQKKITATSTYLPKILDSLLFPLMRLSNTGLVLETWLRKHK